MGHLEVGQQHGAGDDVAAQRLGVRDRQVGEGEDDDGDGPKELWV